MKGNILEKGGIRVVLNISIDENSVIVRNTETGGKWTNKTSNFFGLVYDTLEKQFPDFKPEELGARIAAHVLKGIQGKAEGNPAYMFHCQEIGSTLYDLLSFIDNRRMITPTLKDIENLRIAHRMTVNYLPTAIDNKTGMNFEGLRTVSQVMVAALYYYAYHDYKLVRCKHCGKWFATKTLKQEYCDRISPCFNVIVKGKKPLSCEQAVRNIFQKCGRIKNRIETKANQTVSAQLHRNSFIDRFQRECEPLYLSAKESPTVQNLTNYYNFLKQTDKEKGWLA